MCFIYLNRYYNLSHQTRDVIFHQNILCQMATLPVYTYDSRVLREKTIDVVRPDDEIIRLVMDMFETMNNARGIGLAANQVGKEHSIFVVDITDNEEENQEKPLVAINPVITDKWGDDVPFEEGCLSVPNVREDIIRPESVHLKYRDLNFEEQELEANGLLARVIQHEYDHLQGIFFTDYLKGLRKRLVQSSLKKIMLGEMEAEYDLAPGILENVE